MTPQKNAELKSELQKCRNVLIQSNDPRFNYAVLKKEDIENYSHETPEIIPLYKYDYSFKTDEGDDAQLPKLTPASLTMSKDNLEEVEEWFAAKYPRLPSEYHGVMARYSTGQLLTKKETKNALKKMKKKPEKETPVGLQVARGKILVEFD
tara:strand:+ start:1860 stop:2312 length:453 start_codon:yes stop_codon:yes gene_type:complete